MSARTRVRTREDWVQSSYRMLERGESISARAVAAQLNATTGSLYHHFTDLEELLTAVNVHHLEVSLEFLKRADTHPDPSARLRFFIRDVFDNTNYMRADLALETFRGAISDIDDATLAAEAIIDTWMRDLVSELGVVDRTARDRCVRLLRISYLGLAATVALMGSLPPEADRRDLADTLASLVVSFGESSPGGVSLA